MEGEDPVTIDFFSEEEVNGVDKFNYASNTLDKDNSSVWAADDDAILAGDYKGDGEYIIYDLGSEYFLDLIQFSTTNKSDAFGFQVWVSTTGTDASDFSMILPTSGDLILTATNTTDFNQYEVNSSARYIKLLGYGRFNSAGDTRVSPWNAVGEIEFFGDSVLSIDNYDLNNNIHVYPVPAVNTITIRNVNDIEIDLAKIYSLDGKLLIETSVKFLNSEFSIDISNISIGTYILKLSGVNDVSISKYIIVKD